MEVSHCDSDSKNGVAPAQTTSRRPITVLVYTITFMTVGALVVNVILAESVT